MKYAKVVSVGPLYAVASIRTPKGVNKIRINPGTHNAIEMINGELTFGEPSDDRRIAPEVGDGILINYAENERGSLATRWGFAQEAEALRDEETKAFREREFKRVMDHANYLTRCAKREKAAKAAARLTHKVRVRATGEAILVG